jgi:hypothetical protein
MLTWFTTVIYSQAGHLLGTTGGAGGAGKTSGNVNTQAGFNSAKGAGVNENEFTDGMMQDSGISELLVDLYFV